MTKEISIFEEATRLDENVGGKSIAVLGEVGANKSSLITGLAERALALDERLVWHGKPIDQWHQIKTDRPIRVHIPKGVKTEILLQQRKRGGWTRDIREGRDDIEIREYKGPVEVSRNLCKSLNVVYVPEIGGPWKEVFWTLLLYQLRGRPETDWLHVTIDETADIFPYVTDSVDYCLSPVISGIFADTRKAYMNVIVTAHVDKFLHSAIRGTIPYLIQLQNRDAAKGSPVTAKTVRALALGEGYIEGRTPSGYKFSWFPFTIHSSLRDGTQVVAAFADCDYVPHWTDGSMDRARAFLNERAWRDIHPEEES